ncbi:unnamed protein product [Tenebrio molitor]|nr:unnamed protein product [Tenebrio molitor]
MKLTQATYYALRLSFIQNVPAPRRPVEKIATPAAFFLASLGVGLSSYSVTQMLATSKRRSNA